MPHVRGRSGVLVLHSYSPDFVWTQSQQAGVDAVFGPLAGDYDLRIEYLDAVHHPELLKGPELLELLRAKLSRQRFQVVLTSDNAAFDYARVHRPELFPGVPIVFTGVNGYRAELLQGETGITGVAEDTDLAGTLRVLLQLRPGTKRIVFPGMADDLTYRAIRSTVARELAAVPPQVATVFPEYPDVDAAVEDLRRLPQDAAIVIMSNMRTADGEGITSQRVVELVSDAAPVPVFTNWDFVVGHGALGGSVISGVEQGRRAAEIALRVLRGERPESIPVSRGVGNTLAFDHRQLTRFQIPASRLPPGAVVLFKPERIFRVSEEAAWVAAVSFAMLLAVTASLVLSVRRRRRAEAGLREANERLQAVFRAATDYSIIGTDPEGRILLFSEGAELMLGHRAREVLGRPMTALIHDPAEIAARAAELGLAPGFEVFAAAARRGSGETRVWTYLRKDGTRFPVALTTAAMRDPDGALLGFIGIARDVTQQLRAEEEVRTLNQELEARVVARTAELQAVNDEQAAFTYSVSHDLRAPVRHIDGFAGLLRSRAGSALDPQSVAHLDAIAASARRMGALIDDLLAFSRMGRRDMQSAPVDLGAVAAGVVAELAPEAQGRSVRWSVGELPVVAGDRAMLRQVLLNLLSNALKFTRSRPEPTITLGWRPEGREAVFFVRDNGVGFDPRYAAKLFGVFQRLHGAEEFEGTGIGLAMVRRIVARHGGRVWAEGNVGEGATFFFTLPAAPASASS
jgi:PAS domain S-box-containing protein